MAVAMKTDLNDFSARIHKQNIGWWTNPSTGQPELPNRLGRVALMISEVSEALEGERKDLMDDKLPHRRMAEVEMADTYIRILDYCGGFGVHLVARDYAFEIPDHKGEALFRLMRLLTGIGDDSKTSQSGWAGLSLAYIEAYCAKFGYDLFGAIKEKLEYNANREDHKHEQRTQPGGKKW